MPTTTAYPPRSAPGGVGLRSGVVNCAAYEHGVRVADIEVADVHELLTNPDRFIWIGMYEPGEELFGEALADGGSVRPERRRERHRLR